MNTSRYLLLALLACLLVLIPACSDDDEGNPTNVPPQTYSDPQLQAMTHEGTLVVQGLIDMFPTWMAGQMGKKDATTPEWDSGCQCWRWSDSESESIDELYNWSRTWNFALTYYQGETPQMEFEGADSIGMVLGYHFGESDYRNENNSYNTNFYFTVALTGVPNGPDSIMVGGSGEGEFSGYFTVGEDHTQIYEDIGVMLNLTMPILGGCPAGSLEFDTESTSFTVSFVGESTAYWDYVTGPGESQQGTIDLTCGK